MVKPIYYENKTINTLKEINISYNMFSGLVSRNLAKLDVLNMTMINDKGLAVALNVALDRSTAIASED